MTHIKLEFGNLETIDEATLVEWLAAAQKA